MANGIELRQQTMQPPTAGRRNGREVEGSKHFYVSVRTKFLISTFAACCWFAFSLLVSLPWMRGLGAAIGTAPAVLIILFVALIPGFLVCHLLFSLLLDDPPALNLDIEYPPVTLLIAAYNEADNVGETFRGIGELEYPGPIEVILVDDGSTDGTVDLLRSLGFGNLKIIQAQHGGKANALNVGLAEVRTEYFVSIDADTFLHPQSLKRIMARFLSDPKTTVAVAGSVLEKNSRASLMTRLQEWDYFAAIASVKRQQGLYQGALVAQGAFSAFKTETVREVQGWPSVIGEDIVMTWALLKAGYRIGYEATAVGFTVAPTTLRGFLHQRKRWARGMIEGFKNHGDIIWERPQFPAFFVGVDFLFPFIDTFYTFVYIPGLLLAFTGRFYIVGPLTLLVLPLTFLVVFVMYIKEKKIFNLLGLKVRRNRLGMVMFVLFYQFIMSPTCVVGYFQEMLGFAKRW